MIHSEKSKQDWIDEIGDVIHHILRNASGHREDPAYKGSLNKKSCEAGREALAELTFSQLGNHMRNVAKTIKLLKNVYR